MLKNEFNQPIGPHMEHWQCAKRPPKTIMEGTYSILEPLNPTLHARALFDLFTQDQSSWTYLAYGPFHTFDDFYAWLNDFTTTNDPLFYAILNKKNSCPLGIASYARINPECGSIEIGHLHFSNQLKKTPIATEAMFLMMQRAFEELNYRRYEWKCDALNQASRRAAERFGFTFEGIFRQERIYKNRNRDTAWFSIIDHEWPTVKARFQKWLHPTNFDKNGYQIMRLKETCV